MKGGGRCPPCQRPLVALNLGGSLSRWLMRVPAPARPPWGSSCVCAGAGNSPASPALAFRFSPLTWHPTYPARYCRSRLRHAGTASSHLVMTAWLSPQCLATAAWFPGLGSSPVTSWPVGHYRPPYLAVPVEHPFYRTIHRSSPGPLAWEPGLVLPLGFLNLISDSGLGLRDRRNLWELYPIRLLGLRNSLIINDLDYEFV